MAEVIDESNLSSIEDSTKGGFEAHLLLLLGSTIVMFTMIGLLLCDIAGLHRLDFEAGSLEAGEKLLAFVPR